MQHRKRGIDGHDLRFLWKEDPENTVTIKAGKLLFPAMFWKIP